MYPNNYGYYPQAMQQAQQPTMQSYASQMRMAPQGLKGRPVSSLDEARASTIDFDGSVTFFPDLANKRIYTKQINLDGTASLLMYELKDFPVTQATSETSYVSKEEFQQTVSVLIDEINRLKGGTEVASDEQQQQQQPKQPIPEFKF